MVREDDYLRLRAAEEDLEDVRLYDEAKSKPSEFIPLELTERMLNGLDKRGSVWMITHSGARGIVAEDVLSPERSRPGGRSSY